MPQVPASLLLPPDLLLVLGALSAIGPLSTDMYLSSFPSIAEALSVPHESVELSLASFFVGLALGQLLYGKVTDRYGRKPPLYFGLSLYTLASLGCAMAPGIEAFVALRFLQAVGACAGMVISRATIRDLFGHQQAARVFSFLMLVMGVAPLVAPLLGSLIGTLFGWRALFGFMAGAGATCLVLIARSLPETHKPDPGVRLRDTFGTFRAFLHDREFMGYIAAGSLAQAGVFAYITGSPFVFIELFGIPADRYAWIFGLNVLGLILMSQVNGHLLRSLRPEDILKFSYTAVGLVAVALSLTGPLRLGPEVVLTLIFVYSSVLGITFPNTMAGALARQGAQAGSASAVLGTVQFALASLSSATVSRLHDGTPLPMTLTMGACGIGAFLVFRNLIWRRPHPIG